MVVEEGPAGVEVAAEIFDMIHKDLYRLYPSLMRDMQVRPAGGHGIRDVVASVTFLGGLAAFAPTCSLYPW